MARLESGMAVQATGSERYSAPAGTRTSGDPEKSIARSDVGSIAGASSAIGRAMWTDVKWSGAVPKALERRMRSVLPPMERWTIWRTVASRRSSGGMEFWGSGIWTAVAHEPVQTGC